MLWLLFVLLGVIVIGALIGLSLAFLPNQTLEYLVERFWDQKKVDNVAAEGTTDDAQRHSGPDQSSSGK